MTFTIRDNILIDYCGTESHVVMPDTVTSIAIMAFATGARASTPLACLRESPTLDRVRLIEFN